MMDFKQAFQDEARELLVELESALLELDQNRDDREVLGRAFRALHTIKGSGAEHGRYPPDRLPSPRQDFPAP